MKAEPGEHVVDAGGSRQTASGYARYRGESVMEQTGQVFHWVVLAIPALFAFIPGFLFFAGFRVSRGQTSPLAGKSLYWLGAHGLTLVLVSLLTVLRGVVVPNMIVVQLPLLFTLLYLILGLSFRSPFIFSLGLATPGLWMFLVKCWEAFSESSHSLYHLPQDPFWYFLAAILIFASRYLSRPRDFWREFEVSLVTISNSYLMGALWLLALGQPSLLSGIGLSRHVWAIALLAVSAFLLWCAKFLRDPLFAGCSVIGLAAGVYSLIAVYPW